MLRLIAGLNALRRFKTDAFLSPKMYFFHLLLDYNLFEMNISYGFGNIKFTTVMSTAFGAVDCNLNTETSPTAVRTPLLSPQLKECPPYPTQVMWLALLFTPT